MIYGQAVGTDPKHLDYRHRTCDLGNQHPKREHRSGMVWNHPGQLGGAGIAVSPVSSETGRYCQKTRLCWGRELFDLGPCHRLFLPGRLEFQHARIGNLLHRSFGTRRIGDWRDFRTGSIQAVQGSKIVVRAARGPSAGADSLRIFGG